MKQNITTVLIGLTASVLLSCNSSGSSYQPPNYSSSSPSSGKQTNTGEGLTDSKVETAVNSLLADWRLGGSVHVKGVQELPQQDSAIADLQFEQFEYGVTFEGGIIKARDFKPKPMPQGRDRLPDMDEMFPQKKTVYAKDGKAILSRYNDGRWVLKEVRWGFDMGITGTIGIQ